MKKWTPVIVTWKDAVTYHDPAGSNDEFRTAERRSIGFFLKQNAEAITICMEDDRRCKDASNDCQTVTVLPLGMVISIQTLQEKPITRARI